MLKCTDHRISVRNLRILTVIGTHDFERKIKQEVICNLDLKLHKKAIFSTDSLCDTVDYGAVAKCLTDWIESQQSHLIEHLAYGAVQRVFELDPRICSVRLEVFKPGCIGNADGAAVELSYLKSESLDNESTGFN